MCFFGGNSGDGGQSEIAKQQLKLQQAAAAEDKRRFDMMQAQSAADKAAQAAKEKEEAENAAAEEQKLKEEAAAQAAAQKATNAAANFDTTRTDQAKQLAGLPGFGDLYKKYNRAGQNQQAGAMGQSNSLMSGGQFGGRTYTA